MCHVRHSFVSAMCVCVYRVSNNNTIIQQKFTKEKFTLVNLKIEPRRKNLRRKNKRVTDEKYYTII